MIIREPRIEDEKSFIVAMQSSVDLHHHWVNPPKTKEAFKDYIHRSLLPNQKSFLMIDALEDVIGVFNLNEIIFGSFKSAYLGFYSVNKYSGKGYMSRG